MSASQQRLIRPLNKPQFLSRLLGLWSTSGIYLVRVSYTYNTYCCALRPEYLSCRPTSMAFSLSTLLTYGIGDVPGNDISRRRSWPQSLFRSRAKNQHGHWACLLDGTWVLYIHQDHTHRPMPPSTQQYNQGPCRLLIVSWEEENYGRELSYEYRKRKQKKMHRKIRDNIVQGR